MHYKSGTNMRQSLGGASWGSCGYSRSSASFPDLLDTGRDADPLSYLSSLAPRACHQRHGVLRDAHPAPLPSPTPPPHTRPRSREPGVPPPSSSCPIAGMRRLMLLGPRVADQGYGCTLLELPIKSNSYPFALLHNCNHEPKEKKL